MGAASNGKFTEGQTSSGVRYYRRAGEQFEKYKEIPYEIFEVLLRHLL